MEENNIENVVEEQNKNIVPPTPILFWGELKKEAKEFLKSSLKRFLLPIGITFFFFLCTFLILLPIAFFPTKLPVILISLVFSFIFGVFGFYPSLLALSDIFIAGILSSEVKVFDLPFWKFQYLFFIGIIKSIIRIFKGSTKLFVTILKTALFYLALIILVCIPSHFVKISAEPQYFSFIQEFYLIVKGTNLNLIIENILLIFNYFKIELLVINLLTFIFMVINVMFSFFYINMNSSAFLIGLKKSIINKGYRTAIRQNKWSFAAFFVNSFKYYFLVFVGLLGVFSLLYSFLVEEYFLIFILTIVTTVTSLYIVVPFFICVMLLISVSFTDLFLFGVLTQVEHLADTTKNEDEHNFAEKYLNKFVPLYKMIKVDRKKVYYDLKNNIKDQNSDLINQENKQVEGNNQSEDNKN